MAARADLEGIWIASLVSRVEDLPGVDDNEAEGERNSASRMTSALATI